MIVLRSKIGIIEKYCDISKYSFERFQYIVQEKIDQLTLEDGAYLSYHLTKHILFIESNE